MPVRLTSLKTLLYCLLSPILLWLAFPELNLEYFAWFSFVPLLFIIRNKSGTKAFWLSYFSGFIFFILTLYWLVHVTLIGLIILCLYLAFYFAFFGYFFVCFRKKFSRLNIFLVLFLSSLWVILEYIRSQVLTGFPWALLGYSQYLNIYIIQLVDITGGLGLSFLVMFVNLCVLEIIELLSQRKFKLAAKIISNVLLIFLLIYGYGFYSLNKYSKQEKTTLGVSLIQGNIPQENKWQSNFKTSIKEVYFDLSFRALKENPDIIIWPETAYPDYIVSSDKQTLGLLSKIVRDTKCPLLFGAIYQKQDNYFNSAVLITDDSTPVEVYNKIHLVPFGEYLPLRKYILSLENFVPIADFNAGSEFVIFKVKNKQNKNFYFGVLICFEDTIAELSRIFRLRGADFLVNITNDAWFKKSSSPYQHLQASVFRAVENRICVLRAANTGVSCAIDKCGRIIKRVKDIQGRDIFVRGFIKTEVTKQGILSFYSLFGDIFVSVCILYTLLFVIYYIKKKFA
ncbi:MAG: apolipoprotein N-acyltransferase [Candidatus Omnitrophica bacterium]|nr:apolipoprotein N-acyltransferase [Candidatus Omnitrophota bacterium]MDD5351754.1 apolipoprotein N-acyltransferase [Candidatus Omnitrophota bacterium]MDD5550965.1 apolipoprotein N-acyltransferase [Candidatus Omnitrophota bacterium]